MTTSLTLYMRWSNYCCRIGGSEIKRHTDTRINTTTLTTWTPSTANERKMDRGKSHTSVPQCFNKLHTYE